MYYVLTLYCNYLCTTLHNILWLCTFFLFCFFLSTPAVLLSAQYNEMKWGKCAICRIRYCASSLAILYPAPSAPFNILLVCKLLHLFSCHLLVTATKTIMARCLTNSLHWVKNVVQPTTTVVALVSTSSTMATQMLPTTNIISKTKITMSHDYSTSPLPAQ